MGSEGVGNEADVWGVEEVGSKDVCTEGDVWGAEGVGSEGFGNEVDGCGVEEAVVEVEEVDIEGGVRGDALGDVRQYH